MLAIDSIVSVLGAAAVVPPLLYLLTLTFFDKRPEPAHAVVGTFLLAALSTASLQLLPHSPTAFSDAILNAILPQAGKAFAWFDPGQPLATLAQAVVDIALPEETLKFLVLMVFARRFLAYDHPMEGVVYGAAVGLGLAAYENLLLAVYLPDAWREHSFVRSVLTVPMHGALGVIAGVYVARAEFGNTLGAHHGASRMGSYLAAWFVPIACHAFYNFPLLLVRNTVGLRAPYSSMLQSAGFVIGTLVVLGAARLVYRVTLAQGPSRGRYGRGSLFGYRAWRLDVLGGFASLTGALMILVELRAWVQGEPFAVDRHVLVFLGACFIAAAAALHHRAIRTDVAVAKRNFKPIT